jgi:hypothetical protein
MTPEIKKEIEGIKRRLTSLERRVSTHRHTAVDGTASLSKGIKVDLEQKIWIGKIFISAGAGSPESRIAANVGSMYLQTNGGSGTTLYIKESGTGNTGWSTTA